MRKRLGTPAAMGLILLIASSAWASTSQGTSPAEKAIQKRREAFVAAFNRGNAKALAAFWTADGDYVDEAGSTVKGREALEETYQKLFADNKGAKLHVTVTALRVVNP